MVFKKERPDIAHLVTIKLYLYGGIISRLTGVPGLVSAVSGLGTVFISKNLKGNSSYPAIGYLLKAAYSFIQDDFRGSWDYYIEAEKYIASDDIDKILTRVTLPASFFLALIAVFPIILFRAFNEDISYSLASFYGGTSLLIIVGVALDTLQQIESHMLMRNYDGFLNKGKIRGRSRRY